MRFIFLALALATLTSCRAYRKVLIIGDSHLAGPIGAELDKLTRTHVTTASYGSCGASPHWFFTHEATPCGYFEKDYKGNEKRLPSAPTPDIVQLVNTLHPDYTVVELGANLLGAPNDVILESAKKLISEIRHYGSKCIWLGPPHGRYPLISNAQARLDEVAGLLAKASQEAKCDYIDTRGFAQYPAEGGDGVHFEGAQAQQWAQKAFEEIRKRVERYPGA